MKRKALLWLTVCCATILSCWDVAAQLPTPAPADLPTPPYATITYSDGSSVIAPGAGGTFPLVGLLPGQAVQVTVQYPSPSVLGTISRNNAVVFVQALDGGAVAPPAGSGLDTVAADPSCHPPGCTVLPFLVPNGPRIDFTFVAGSLPGSYRIVLRQGTGAMLLQFWVQDPVNPQNNPPVITPATPNDY